MTRGLAQSDVVGSTTPLQVLVVEDDPDDVLLCRAAISGAPGLHCRVSTAATLREALAHLDAEPVDVALVDLSLPDAVGLDAITTMAQRFEDLPLIVLTGLHDEEAATLALQAGAQDYLIKDNADRAIIGRAMRYAIERRHAEQVRRARDAAEAASHAKTAFVSRMSHELRTPLNAVLGFAQVLRMDELSADQVECLDQIDHAGRHLLALIGETIDIARIESGELSLSMESIPLDEVVDSAVDLVRPLADRRDITIERGGELLHVHADRKRCTEVILNLLSNAVKYNHVGGRIDVHWASVGEAEAVVDVRDSGPGIAADNLPRLFTPFERLGAEMTSVEGTGVGLALSRRLAEAMGGGLTVESTLGQGSTFFLRLTVAHPGEG
ncbi:MAG: ATP-binding response regulator [Actinomycetes bacterium]